MPKKQADSNMSDPQEFSAWAFAAGVPDPRGEQFGHQPLIPAPCFPAVSQMLWDFGFRHDASLQTKWVPDYVGPDRNHIALGVSENNPAEAMQLAAEMLVDQYPDIADKISEITPENRDAVMREQAEELMASIAKLQAATAVLNEIRQEGQP
jgi:hypothetical protein